MKTKSNPKKHQIRIMPVVAIVAAWQLLGVNAGYAQMPLNYIKSFCGNGRDANRAGYSFFGQTYTQQWRTNLINSGTWRGEEQFWQMINHIHTEVARNCPDVW